MLISCTLGEDNFGEIVPISSGCFSADLDGSVITEIFSRFYQERGTWKTSRTEMMRKSKDYLASLFRNFNSAETGGKDITRIEY